MIIPWSQIVLIAVLLFFIYYLLRLRSILMDRLLYLGFAILGIFFVLVPGVSTKIANLIGIGRGADLIFYLFIIASLFYTVTTRTAHQRQQQQITAIVRQLAMTQPVKIEPLCDDNEK